MGFSFAGWLPLIATAAMMHQISRLELDAVSVVASALPSFGDNGEASLSLSAAKRSGMGCCAFAAWHDHAAVNV